MDWHDTLFAANGNERIASDVFGALPGSAPRWEESRVHPPALKTSVSAPTPAPTAGDLLSRLMDLRAARAPLATQQELCVLLQRIARSGMLLPHDAFFYTNAEVLGLVSQAIASQLMSPTQPGDVYLGVQRLSRLAGVLPHYRGLLQRAHSICLYGLNDLHQVSPRVGFSHPRLVTLELDPSRRTDLEWCWFLVVNIPDAQAALMAQQVEGDLWSDSPQTRMYRGLWTFDPARVQQMVGILRQAARSLLR